MLFKPRAQKLVEEFDANKPGASPGDFRKYRDLVEKIRKWGAAHPEEFIPLLTDDRANSIGTWIRDSGDKGIGLLRDIIRDPAAPQRSAALRALWEFEEAAESEISLLSDLLDDPDPSIRKSAAHCLGRIGPRAVSVGAKLANLAQYGNDEEKGSAFFALERTGYDPMITAQICYDAAVSGSQTERRAALSTLQAIGADLTPVTNSLFRALEESGSESLEHPVIKLLMKVDFSDDTLRRRAIHALESFIARQPPGQTNALTALWKLDPGNPTVIAHVENDLQSNDSHMESACDVICEMKEAASRFVPLLIQQLQQHSGYWDFCWAAVDALAQIGPAAEAAASSLEKLQKHPSELVQERAARALAKIRGEDTNEMP